MSDAPETDTTAEEAAPAEPVVTFAVMEHVAVRFDLPSPSPILTLEERVEPFRQLELPIALPEAQAIGQVLEGVSAPRPSTHDLMANTLRELGVDVVAARIVNNVNGVYYAELDLMGPRGRAVLDCRVSDAVAVALRQNVRAPILVDERLF